MLVGYGKWGVLHPSTLGLVIRKPRFVTDLTHLLLKNRLDANFGVDSGRSCYHQNCMGISSSRNITNFLAIFGERKHTLGLLQSHLCIWNEHDLPTIPLLILQCLTPVLVLCFTNSFYQKLKVVRYWQKAIASLWIGSISNTFGHGKSDYGSWGRISFT